MGDLIAPVSSSGPSSQDRSAEAGARVPFHH